MAQDGNTFVMTTEKYPETQSTDLCTAMMACSVFPAPIKSQHKVFNQSVPVSCLWQGVDAVWFGIAMAFMIFDVVRTIVSD